MAPTRARFSVALAMMLVLPVSTARMSPAIESTLATLALLDRHWNVATPASGGHGRKLAFARKESPTCSVADGGLTVAPGSVHSGVVCTVFVPSALHAPIHSPNPSTASKTLIPISR
jgi:hypothetical protein